MKSILTTVVAGMLLLGSATAGWAVPTCSDGLENADETNVDCGGVYCAPCSEMQPAPVGTPKRLNLSLLPLPIIANETLLRLVAFRGNGDHYLALFAQVPLENAHNSVDAVTLVTLDRGGKVLQMKSIVAPGALGPRGTIGLRSSPTAPTTYVGIPTEGEGLHSSALYEPDDWGLKLVTRHLSLHVEPTDITYPLTILNRGGHGLSNDLDYLAHNVLWHSSPDEWVSNSYARYNFASLTDPGLTGHSVVDHLYRELPSGGAMRSDGRAIAYGIQGNQIVTHFFGGGSLSPPALQSPAAVHGVIDLEFYGSDKLAVAWTNRGVYPTNTLKVARYDDQGAALGPEVTLLAQELHGWESGDKSLVIAPDGSIIASGLDREGTDFVEVHFVSPADQFVRKARYYSPSFGSDEHIQWHHVAALDNGDAMLLVQGAGAQVYVQAFVHWACGNGIVETDNSEECDDSNLQELDGCASDCTFQGCGDGVTDSGEQCDDGNRTNGDGCSSQCLDEESVDTTVGPGGSADSDSESDGATAADPLETAVTVPGGADVTILETDDEGASSGYTGLGKKVVISVTPGGTVSNPLEIRFTADASIIPAGETPSTVQVFRNGARVLGCTGAPSAIPDPCISSIQPVGNDFALTVLTSAASTWELGFACGDGNVNSSAGEQCDDGNAVAGDGCSAKCQLESVQDKDQVKCIATLTKSVLGIAKTQAKLNIGCVKSASGEDIPNALACLLADEKGKVGKAKLKLNKNGAKKCVGSAVPDFGYSGSDGFGANEIWSDFLQALIGDPSTNVVLASADKAAATCQQALLKAADKHTLAIVKEFGSCLSAGLKAAAPAPPAIRSGDGLASCILADPEGKIAESLAKLATVRPEACASVDLTSAFAGDCSAETGSAFDACVATRANCAACRVAKLAHRLSVDCDIVDDNLRNLTCNE